MDSKTKQLLRLALEYELFGVHLPQTLLPIMKSTIANPVFAAITDQSDLTPLGSNPLCLWVVKSFLLLVDLWPGAEDALFGQLSAPE